MRAVFHRYGFAGAVVAVVALVAGAVGLRIASEPEAGGGPGAGAAARPTGPGGAGPGGGGAGRDLPRVQVATVAPQPFFEPVSAIGTAQARESIVVAAKVTDVISRLRFDSGDRVVKGQVLVELANVEQQADLAEARASLEVEERELNRIQELSERGFAPRARLEEAQAAHARAAARVNALQSRIADRTIRAPFAGVMGLRTASPGALVRPGDPIATLDDVSEIKLDFDIAEPQFPLVPAGAAIVASTPAYPGEAFEGVVEMIDSRVDPRTRTLRARAILPNRDGRLKPGMLMTVEVRARPRQALGVPDIAVLESQEGPYVFVVAEGERGVTAERRPVRTGLRAAGVIEVLEGLSAGERIVSIGVQRAQPGQPLQIVNDAAARPDATPEAPPSAPRTQG